MGFFKGFTLRKFQAQWLVVKKDAQIFNSECAEGDTTTHPTDMKRRIGIS